jgi:biotin transport system substrate-specific component
MPSLVSSTSLASPTRLYFQSVSGRVFLALAASGLVALSAHVSVPLGFTPVPLTLQTFAVLLIGFLLGPTLGFFSLMAYLVEGLCGLPVFSPHGVGGAAQLLGPTGGYLLAYPLMATYAGFLAKAPGLRRMPFVAYTVAGTAATVLLFACGAGWIMSITHISLAAAWTVAIAPFLPGEVVKIAAAAGISRALYRHRIS